MDEIKKLIEQLKSEGKSVAEISAAVALMDEAKEMDTTKIIEDVQKHLKALEVKATVEDTEAKTLKDTEFQKAVAEAVKVEMKANPAKQEKPVKEVKLFNVITGKREDYKKMSDSYKAIADSLYFSLIGDMASVKSIKEDVDSEVKAQMESLGIKTALYSNTGSGAYTIPTEVSADIAVSRYNLSRMYQKCNKAGILFNSKVYPVATDITLAHRTNENTAWSDVTNTLENPTLTVKEYGGLALLSRRLVELRSPEVVNMLVEAAGSADARFIDTAISSYSVTTTSDPYNGLIFDSLTAGVDDKALTAISDKDFIDLVAELSANVDDITFIANRKVRNLYGRLETEGGGNRIFKDFMSNGAIAPMGYEFVENRKIPSTLTINSSSGNTNDRTTGTSDCLIAADLSKLLVVAGMMRIDYSEHYKFAEDQVAWKFVNEIASDVITDSGNVVASVIELTN